MKRFSSCARAQNARAHPAPVEDGEAVTELTGGAGTAGGSLLEMQIVDCGTGAPIVMIPGIQGRWEYMRPAIDALAASFRVVTYPLCGERGSRRSLNPTRGWDDFVDQIDAVLDDRHLARATICGCLRRAHRASIRRAASDGPPRSFWCRHRDRASVSGGVIGSTCGCANPRSCLSREVPRRSARITAIPESLAAPRFAWADRHPYARLSRSHGSPRGRG